MSLLSRFRTIPAVGLVTFVLLGVDAGSPAHAAKICTADCESEVSVDTTRSPCTYTWADAKFQVPPNYTPILRWKLKGSTSAIWTNDGIFLNTPPENDPAKDLTSNSVESGGYYKWEVVHLRAIKFTVDMNIFNGAEQCKKSPAQGDYEIELQ